MQLIKIKLVDNGDLEAELLLVEEEYFGERFEEKILIVI